MDKEEEHGECFYCGATLRTYGNFMEKHSRGNTGEKAESIIIHCKGKVFCQESCVNHFLHEDDWCDFGSG
jgi:hypothetical protein